MLLCKEAFEEATKLDNLTTIDIDCALKTRYEHFGEKCPEFSSQLGKDGEIGDQRAPYLLVGSSCDFDGNSYCM